MSLLHHEAPNVVVFYLHLPEMLAGRSDLEDILRRPTQDEVTAADRGEETARKAARNDAVTALVVNAVRALLRGKVVSAGADENVLIAVDEGGANREFGRGYCAVRDDIVQRVMSECFNDDKPRVIHLAIAGTGVEASDLEPASDDNSYVLLEPCPDVWGGCCAANSDRVAKVLPADPEAEHTPLQRLVRNMVSNARAAAVLARVAKQSTVHIRPDTDHHLIRLCGQATEELRRLNGLRYVTDEELAAIFVHAAFLQGTQDELTPADFNLVRRFGVLVETTPPKLTDSGPDGASPKDCLRRFEMPEVFSAWLHFMVRFGLKKTAGDDFEETVAEYASLALIAPQAQSYFSDKYWKAFDERRPLSHGAWRHPFELFDFITTLPGRELQAGCVLIRLKSHFAAKVGNGLIPSKKKASKTNSGRSPGGKASKANAVSPDVTVRSLQLDGRFNGLSKPHLKALAAQLTTELPLDPHRHTIVINGPQAPFADLMIFPHGNITDHGAFDEAEVMSNGTFNDDAVSDDDEMATHNTSDDVETHKPRHSETLRDALTGTSRHIILVQCKGSADAAVAPTRFTAHDLFVELYKMGSSDALSYVAHLLDDEEPPTKPKKRDEDAQDDEDDEPAPPSIFDDVLDSIDACALASLVRLGRSAADVFSVAMEIMEESNLLASVLNDNPAFLHELLILQAQRREKDVALLQLLNPGVELSVPPFPQSLAPAATTPSSSLDQIQAVQYLRGTIAERERLIMWMKGQAVSNGATKLTASGKVLQELWHLLLSQPESAEAAAIKPCFRLTAVPTVETEQLLTGRALSRLRREPNPTNRLLQALEIAHDCRYKVARVVVVWQREVDPVPERCLPEGSLLIHTKPWTDKVWPPTNLYPLVEHSVHVESQLLHADWKHSLREVLYRRFRK